MLTFPKSIRLDILIATDYDEYHGAFPSAYALRTDLKAITLEFEECQASSEGATFSEIATASIGSESETISYRLRKGSLDLPPIPGNLSAFATLGSSFSYEVKRTELNTKHLGIIKKLENSMIHV